MNRGEIRAYARRLLAEQTAADSFWSDADLNDYINRAYEEVVTVAELLHCTSLGNSQAGVQEYPFPKDTLGVVRVFYLDPADGKFKEVHYRSLEDMDFIDPIWPVAVCESGEIPGFWTVRGQLLHLVPAPYETGIQNIRLWCIQAPAPLTDDAQEPEIPLSYHEAIAVGAAKRALLADRTNPDNERTVRSLDTMFQQAVAVARSQHLRKPRNQTRLQDMRDFYSQEWRP